jgi:hypothetical protein
MLFFIIILRVENANINYQMESSTIFPLFYLPPVNYFSKLKALDYHYKLEKFEHFPKQTYRNRAAIYSPNGTLNLVVPVVKGSKVHTPYKDVKISYDLNWQRLHWKSFESCYRNSAYFEYYEDEFQAFYTKNYKFLFDFNIETYTWILRQLKQSDDLNFTDEYVKPDIGVEDQRSMFDKRISEQPTPDKKYFQVFDDRLGFKPNLSVVDLLFNQGPQAKAYF